MLAKEGTPRPISAAEDIPTEVLPFPSIFSLKTAIPRNWEFRGDQEILENVYLIFKKNLNASKPSEHPPQVEECLKV